MHKFRRSDRIRAGKDWALMRKSKSRASNDALVVCAGGSGKRRLGIVVGSGVGCAVERNRIKRVFREYFRLHREDFPPGDCAIIVRPKAAPLTNGQLREKLAGALKRIMK